MPEFIAERLELEEDFATDRNQPATTLLTHRPDRVEDKKQAALFVAACALLVSAIAAVVYIVQHASKKVECELEFCAKVSQPQNGDCSLASCIECVSGYEAYEDGTTYCGPLCQIELCDKVSVPRGVSACNDTKVTCANCASLNGQQTERKQDSEGEYCGLACPIEHCKRVTVPRGRVDNCASMSVTCDEVAEGYVPMRDEKGAYAGHKCEMDTCSSYKIRRGAGSCKEAEFVNCTACSQGFNFNVDDKWNLGTSCIPNCTNGQIRRGCASFSCSSATSCSKCAAGFTSSGAACEKAKKWNGHMQPFRPPQEASSPLSMEFFMYRASKETPSNSVFENIDLGSAAGVLWFLHKEVVSDSCQPPKMERKNNVDRIQRFKVKVKNTQEVWEYGKHKDTRTHLLGRYVTFDHGQCVTDGCAKVWDKYGYHVGVMTTEWKPRSMGFPYYESRYSNALWYSLPGACPEKKYDDPDIEECAKTQPGGACRGETGDSLPTGTRNCTWQIEGDVREVTLNELTGITDYKAFCDEGKKEYDPSTDRGVNFSWWDKREDDEANAERTRLLLAKFAEKFPDDPVLVDPIFDGF